MIDYIFVLFDYYTNFVKFKLLIYAKEFKTLYYFYLFLKISSKLKKIIVAE